MRVGIAVVAIGVCTLIALPVSAKPAAVQLFREGRALLKAGKLEAACDRFAESQQLAPKVGTLLNLADCLERRGKLASAWRTFLAARALAAELLDRRREEEARRRADTLAPKLGFITLVTPPTVRELVIERDGVVIGPAERNAAMALDAGVHRFAARAPGYRPWSRQHTMGDGERIEITIELVRDGSDVVRDIEPNPPTAANATVADLVGDRSLAVGLLFGSNTKEQPLVGIRVFGSVPIPQATMRISGSVVYSRYGDPDGVPPTVATFDTFYLAAGFDYVRSPIPQLGFAVGLGLGLELDREPGLANNFDGALAVRASPVIVRLAHGAVELGIHTQLAFAGREFTLHALAGLDWFVQ